MSDAMGGVVVFMKKIRQGERHKSLLPALLFRDAADHGCPCW